MVSLGWIVGLVSIMKHNFLLAEQVFYTINERLVITKICMSLLQPSGYFAMLDFVVICRCHR